MSKRADEDLEHIPEEERAGYLARKAREQAEAEQADERAKIETFGGLAGAAIGLLSGGYLLVARENVTAAALAFIVAAFFLRRINFDQATIFLPKQK